MNAIEFKYRLQFEEEELAVREGNLVALTLAAGEDDGAAEHALNQAIQCIARARWELRKAAHAGLEPRQTTLEEALTRSIALVKQRKAAERELVPESPERMKRDAEQCREIGGA